MLKTYKQMKRMEHSSFHIPRTVQQTIPIKRVWKNGIFQLTEMYNGIKQYSVTYKLSDINYSISSQEEKEIKFLQWESVLNSFDPDARYKITVFKRRIDMKKLADTVMIPLVQDPFDKYRNVFNTVLIDKVMEANGIAQDIYLTVTTWKKDLQAAQTFFSRQYTQISQAFSALSVSVEQIDVNERLKIFHDFYRQGEESEYHFNFDDMIRQGADIRDYICPDIYDTDKHSADYFKFGSTYGRALFLRDYASYIKDDIVSQLCSINRPCCFSIDLVAIPTDEAINAANTVKMRVESNKEKRLRKAQDQGRFSTGITYDMKQQLEAAEEYLRDLNERDQRMFIANISMVHLAKTKEELEEDTKEILSAARAKMCQMSTLYFQQLKGLITALPYGVNWLYSERTLTTESAGVFLPFRAQEVMHKGGLYCGVNAVTGNPILVNPALLNNPNRFVVGIPGSGKSFGVKIHIFQLFLSTQHDIIILDPEGEYAEPVRQLGGQIVKLSASADITMNPFDMVDGYADKKNSNIFEKSNFIVTLFEQIDKSDIIGGDDKSIIDRCVRNIYRNCSDTPTLKDLREELILQQEPRAKVLALKLELFTTGSLSIFSNQSNINLNHRVVCFDTSALTGDLKTIGNLIVTDYLINRVTNNAAKGVWTDLFFDEFQTMLRDKYSAEYFNSAWRRYRKRFASPCGITQNIEYLNSDVEFSTMLGNSPFVTLYQLTAEDIHIVSEKYKLSAKQLEYVSASAKPGNGLVKVGHNIVPFDGQWPKGNMLYDLMTTKPGEWNLK